MLKLLPRYLNKSIDKIYGIILFVISTHSTLWSQDPITSLNFINPVMINPAFTSYAEDPTIALNFRDQSSEQTYKYINYNVTYLHPSKFLGGGAGIIVQAERQGDGIINKYFINGLYSYRLQINTNFFIHAGFQASLGYYNLNSSDLIFENSNEVIESERKYFPDFSLGFLGEAKEHSFGISVHHVMQPIESGSSDSIPSRLLRKYTIHYKTNITLIDSKAAFKNLTISPSIVYQIQGSFQHLSYGVMANIYPLLVNIGIRQNINMYFESVNFALGVMQPKFILVYNYDLSLSGLKNMTHFNAHEVTFLLNLQYKQKSKKHKAIKCPKI